MSSTGHSASHSTHAGSGTHGASHPSHAGNRNTHATHSPGGAHSSHSSSGGHNAGISHTPHPVHPIQTIHHVPASHVVRTAHASTAHHSASVPHAGHLSAAAARLPHSQLAKRPPTATGRAVTHGSHEQAAHHLKQLVSHHQASAPAHVLKLTKAANEVAKRVTLSMAFRAKYQHVLLNKVPKNKVGGLTGMVKSAQWRRYFEATKKFGTVLKLAGLGVEAMNRDWSYHSAKGIGSNLMVTVSRWGTDSLISIPQTVVGLGANAAHAGEWGSHQMHWHELESDFHAMTQNMDHVVHNMDRFIDTVHSTLSERNARDVLTWQTSVLNPKNWDLLREGLAAHVDDVAREAHQLQMHTRQAVQALMQSHH